MQISEYGVQMDAEELRGIIRGDIGFRRCPDCQGQGESWTLHYVEANDPDQDNEQFRQVSEQFAADFLVDNYPDLSFGDCLLDQCDTCHGVGYISVEAF
jgi:hypothetical protein